MTSTTFYLRILRLSLTNKKLLDTYSSLLCSSETTNEVLEIKDITTRKVLRENIEHELRECINGSYFANKTPHLDQTSIFCLLSFVKMDTFLEDLFSIDIKEGNKCYTSELENVSQYYNLLYTENLPHNITELLLGQKEKIENYLVEEL